MSWKAIVLVTLSLLQTSIALSQDKLGKVLFGVTNETKNYVYVYGASLIDRTDSNLFYSSREFKVVKQYVKGKLPDNGADVKLGSKEFTLKPVRTVKELRSIVPKNILSSFKKVFNMSTDDEVINYFMSHNEPKDYPIFYNHIEIKIALGHVFEDTDVEPGKKYAYKVYVDDDNGNEIFWGECWLLSGTGNFVFEYLKDWSSSTLAKDSSVSFKWFLNLNSDSLYHRLDRGGRLTQSNIPLILSIPTLNARIFVSKNDGGFVEENVTLMTNISVTGDSLVYDFGLNANPGDFSAAYIRLTDEVGNLGPPSDTAWAYAISHHSIPILPSMRSEDVTDGVRLSWDALPHKPYFSGIMVTRSAGSALPDTLAVLDYKDTSYVDKNLEPATVYTYYAKALYSEGVNYEQEYPAKAVGQYTKFTIPEIPENLTATNVGENVLLKWDKIENPGIYGYYIYKGTHPNKIKLYKGPIKTNSFIDSSKAMSGASVYYYQVRSENFMQDVSDLSTYVSNRPNRPVNMRVPENMSFYYENGNLQVSWNDVRAQDKIVSGYHIKRFEKSIDGTSRLITAEPISATSLIDSTYEKGSVYLYSVAPVSIYGDIGSYSDPKPFLYEMPRFDAVYEFDLINSKEGIMVSVPSVDFGDGRRYRIYRRLPEDTKMSAIATLPDGTFEYIDTSALKGQNYVYAIKILYADGEEGPFGYSKSLRRSN